MQKNIKSPNKAGITKHNQAKFQNGFILLPVVLAITLIAAIAFLMNREGAMAVNELGGEMQTTQASLAAKAGMSHMLWQSTNANCTGYTNLATTNFGNSSYSATITPASDWPPAAKITATGTDANGASVTINRDRVTMYQPYKTVILRLGADPGKDAYISSTFSTSNYGAGENSVLKIFSLYRNQLLQFDLPSTIPVNASIVSAQLLLHQTSGTASGDISVHQITRSWVEGTKNGSGTADGATWKTYDGTNAWTTNGGDYGTTAIATSTVTSGSDVIANFEIAPLVQDWLSGKVTNNGLLLKTEDFISPTPTFTFASKEDATASKRPKLIITYTCECGDPCEPPPSCDAEYTPTLKANDFTTQGYGSGNIKGLTFFPEGNVFKGVTAPVGGAWISVDSGLDQVLMTDLVGSLKSQAATPGTTPTGIAYIADGVHKGQFALTDYNLNSITWINTSGATVSTTSVIVTNPLGVTYMEKTASGTYDGTIAVIDNAKKISIFNQTGSLLKSFPLSAFITQPEDLAHIPGKDRLLVLDRTAQKVVIIDFDGIQRGNFSLASFSLSSAYGIAINPKTCDHAFGDIGIDKVMSINKDPSTPNTITLTVGAVADADIYQGTPSTPYGSDISIVAGKDSAGNNDKILIKFDVSSIPVGATVTSATLRLNKTSTSGSGSYDIGVYKIIASWSEATATWSNFSASGNYNTTQLAVTSVALGTTGFKEWAIPVGLINEWRDGVPGPNYGMALVYEGTTKEPDYQFASKENTTAASRPQLVINYTLP